MAAGDDRVGRRVAVANQLILTCVPRGTQLELRETQLEQGQKIDKLDREMREGFATMATGMAQITALLTNIAGPERDGS